MKNNADSEGDLGTHERKQVSAEMNDVSTAALDTALDLLFDAVAGVRHVLHRRMAVATGRDAMAPASQDEQDAYVTGIDVARRAQRLLAVYACQDMALSPAWVAQGFVDTFAGGVRLDKPQQCEAAERVNTLLLQGIGALPVFGATHLGCGVHWRILVPGEGERVSPDGSVDARVMGWTGDGHWVTAGQTDRPVQRLEMSMMLPALAQAFLQLRAGGRAEVCLSLPALFGATCDIGTGLLAGDVLVMTIEVVAVNVTPPLHH